MLPRESRNPRGQRRARRQTDVSALESLETRTLLAFSTLGYSLPDLAISGEAGPRAAWGGTIDVSERLFVSILHPQTRIVILRTQRLPTTSGRLTPKCDVIVSVSH